MARLIDSSSPVRFYPCVVSMGCVGFISEGLGAVFVHLLSPWRNGGVPVVVGGVEGGGVRTGGK